MATGLVIHISSGDDRHTEILTDDRILIGTSEDCDLRLGPSAFPKGSNGPVLELVRSDGTYLIDKFDGALSPTRNGSQLSAGDALADGDEIRIAESGLVLQFFPVRALPALVKPTSRETHVAPFIE